MTNTYHAEQPLLAPTKLEKMLAWSAHLVTASGAIWGLLTLLAITNQEWIAAFAWMGVAIAVDSFDGFLARRVRVKEVLPEFDGALLDNMLDYLNYVFVPAFYLSQSNLLPDSVSLLGAILILLASAYQFCQDDAKTEDHYFKGFPSYWNIMLFYFFVFGLNDWVNFAITALLAILVFVPIKYIYPSRTTMFRGLTLVLGSLWGLAIIIILFTYPTHAPWLLWMLLIFLVYYTALSLYATYITRK